MCGTGTSLRTFGILVDLLHGLLQMIEHEADHHQDQVPRILLVHIRLQVGCIYLFRSYGGGDSLAARFTIAVM